MSASGVSPFARPFPHTTEGPNVAPRVGSGASSDATQPVSAVPAVRLGRRQLARLADSMPARERAVVETVDRLRLVSSEQLQRLFFHQISSPRGRARVCRRTLRALTEHGLLRRLGRRVGGTPAGGSSGFVYTLAPAGRRLISYWQGEGTASDRGVHEPEGGFVEHTIAISDLYTQLVETERNGLAELVTFDPEPGCWRTYTGPTGATVLLKPDALVRLVVGEDELSWWIEVDMGTNGRGALNRKLAAYISLYRTGREQAETGVFPRCAWITPNTPRALFLDQLIRGLPLGSQRLFAVTTRENQVALLTHNTPDAEIDP